VTTAREEEEIMSDNAEPDEATVEAEQVDAQQAHVADRAPTADEEAEAEKSKEAFAGDSAEVAAHYEEMSDIGAHAKGEGAID
jgi:hypothetical protein